jgi:hypothetical protein
MIWAFFKISYNFFRHSNNLAHAHSGSHGVSPLRNENCDML